MDQKGTQIFNMNLDNIFNEIISESKIKITDLTKKNENLLCIFLGLHFIYKKECFIF